MRRIILIAFSAALSSLAASVSAAPTNREHPKIDTEVDCKKLNGSWEMRVQSGVYICNAPTRDGGKSCINKSDCEGECLAAVGKDGKRLEFRCAAYLYAGDCYVPVNKGQVAKGPTCE